MTDYLLPQNIWNQNLEFSIQSPPPEEPRSKSTRNLYKKLWRILSLRKRSYCNRSRATSKTPFFPFHLMKKRKAKQFKDKTRFRDPKQNWGERKRKVLHLTETDRWQIEELSCSIKISIEGKKLEFLWKYLQSLNSSDVILQNLINKILLSYCMKNIAMIFMYWLWSINSQGTIFTNRKAERGSKNRNGP